MDHAEPGTGIAPDRERAPIGDSPRWILWHVLTTWVGIPAAFLGYAGAGLAAWAALGVDMWPSPRPAITVVVVAVLANLFRLQHRRRPLPHDVRTYYRMALFVIAMFGVMTTAAIGFFLGAALLAHSYLPSRGGEPGEVTRAGTRSGDQ